MEKEKSKTGVRKSFQTYFSWYKSAYDIYITDETFKIMFSHMGYCESNLFLEII